MKKILLLLLLSMFTLNSFAQLTEGFEGTTLPTTLPSTTWTLGSGNWAVFDNTIAVNYRWNEMIFDPTVIPPRVFAGNRAAYMRRENTGSTATTTLTSQDYLATPSVLIPTNGELTFQTRQYYATDNLTKYNIMIKKVADGPQDVIAGYTLIQQYTEQTLNTVAADVYELKRINIPVAYIGQNVYIAFMMEYTQVGPALGGDQWLIDEVKIRAKCLTPTTGVATAITSNSATLGWANPAGATSFEIENILASATPTGIATNTSTTASLPLTGLAGNTIYSFYVRAACSNGEMSTWAGPFNYTTLVPPPACGGFFYDNGGPTANYSNGVTAATGTTVICPVNTADKVTVQFTSFATESGFDLLKIYDGNSSAATLLGTFSGTALPPTFTSTNANGCLTFVFTSDSSVNAAGWVANVTCAPIPTCSKPTALTVGTVTSSTASLSWTQPANPNASTASAWQTLALPCGSPLPTATTTGWVAAPTNPIVLTGLSAGTCYDFYVRAVCSATDSSPWGGPKRVTTMPGCGSTFYDNGGLASNYANSTTAATGTTTICPTNPGDQVTVTFTSFETEAGWDFLKIYDGNSSAATLLGSYSGTALPPTFTGSTASGCLTFVFTSDSSLNAAGWVANVTCAPPPTCTKPNTLTVANITQTTALVGWTQPANPNGSFANSWQVIVLPCGSPIPTATATGWVTANANPYYLTGLTPGTCYDYYVRATCSATDTSLWSTPKSFTTLIPNDDCTGSIMVPVNQNTTCAQTAVGTLESATASVEANSCGGTIDDDDVWFHFTATATTHYVTLLGVNYTAAPTGINFAMYTGTSCGTMTEYDTNLVTAGVQCATANVNTINGLTIGNKYYIRVYSTGTTPTTKKFELCVGSKVVTCNTALPLCAITPIVIPNNVGVPTLPNPVSPYSATSSTVGCLASAPSPTFYYLQIPTNGNYNFFLEQNTNNTFTGTGIDVDFIAWGPYASNAAACAGISTVGANPTGPMCSFSFAFTENFTVNNAIAGQVYVVMITNFTQTRKGFVRITQTVGPLPTNCCPFGNFTYSKSQYCQNEGNPSPIFISNAVAGTFSYTTTGTGTLSINPTTGLVNLAASMPGTYVIRNVIASTPNTSGGICPADDDSFTITITAPSIGTAITYTSPAFCKTDTTLQNVTLTGTSGGNYTVSPATGLSLNTTTGTFTPSTSTVGVYDITYNLSPIGGCPGATATKQVTITALPIGTFNYTASPYCSNGANASPTFIGGGVAGTFTSTTGLVINATTGVVNVATSTAGTYTVTNTIVASGGCAAVIETATITITKLPIAVFSYSGTPYCSNAANPSPTFAPGGVAGIFTTTTGLVINSTTGVIDIATSTPGSYVVTNTIAAAAGCGIVTATTPIVITPLPTATISYAGTPFCLSEVTAMPVTKIQTSGTAGTFNATPTGLSINATTGAITPSTSTAGSYVVTYTIPATGGCAIVTATTPVVIKPALVTSLLGNCEAQFFVIRATPVSGYTASAVTYSWTGTGIIGATNQSSITVADSGTYNLKITDTSGCFTNTSIIVASAACVVMKGISPNNDNANDFFDLTAFKVKKLSIYNRYGKKVYGADNYTKQWYGQSEAGGELPDGTYYYEINRENGESQSGWVYINRENK